MLRFSCEITQNIVFQFLKNFKIQMNFELSHYFDKSIFWLLANYIRKLRQHISASSSRGVKFLIKELLCIHIAKKPLFSINGLFSSLKHVNSFLTSTVDKTNSVYAPFLCKFYVKCLCDFSSYTGCILVGKHSSPCQLAICQSALCMLWLYKIALCMLWLYKVKHTKVHLQ